MRAESAGTMFALLAGIARRPSLTLFISTHSICDIFCLFVCLCLFVISSFLLAGGYPVASPPEWYRN